MYPNYNKKLRAIGATFTIRDVDIPDAKLGINSAERLERIPIKIERRDRHFSTKALIRDIRTMEDLQYDDTGKFFTADEFPKLGYMGEALKRGI